MKHLLAILVLFFSVSGFGQIEKQIPAPANPPRLVNDFTGKFLTQEQVQTLEAKLIAYDDSTSTQITVIVVDNLGGYSPDEYAIAAGRKWGVGGKEFNNGAIILISTGGQAGDRHAFIATGYGLEGRIPDITAQEIVENEMIPNFKQGNNYRGLDDAVDAIIKAAAGLYKAPDGYNSRKGKGLSGWMVLIVIIILIVLFSGAGGGNNGGYVSRRGVAWWLLANSGRGGGGGGWSGGGGGGGGGGFGGFGGGSFGGGGGGGSW